MGVVITRDFAEFVDDIGGFVWAMKDAQHLTWQELATACDLSAPTVRNLAFRVTRNPQLYTLWKVLRGFDKASIIRHSELEKYRGMGRPKGKPKLRAVA